MAHNLLKTKAARCHLEVDVAVCIASHRSTSQQKNMVCEVELENYESFVSKNVITRTFYITFKSSQCLKQQRLKILFVNQPIIVDTCLTHN